MIKFKSHKITILSAQRGFSLMEVLVSVFLVGFALLALVAMQVKTHAGVREAENLTIVAMAVDSLAEGMRANPTLAKTKKIIGSDEVIVTTKSWSTNYDTTAAQYTAITLPCTAPTAAVDKAELAKWQLCQFKASLSNVPDAANVEPTVKSGKIEVKWKTGKSTDTPRSYAVSVGVD